MCDGKRAGDSCSSLYYPAGVCQPREGGCDGKPCLSCESRPGYAFGAGAAAVAAAVIGLILLLKLLRRRKTR